MDIAADLRNIVGHPVQNVAHRSLIHIFDREAADLVGNLDTDAAAVMAAHHIVHQQHIQVAEDAVGHIHPQQRQQSLRERLPDGTHAAALPIVVQLLHQLAQYFRCCHGAKDCQNIQHRTHRQPAGDRLRFPGQTDGSIVN